MKNQKGFAALEGLLLLVIVAMLAVIGWYVKTSADKTDRTLSQTTNSSVQPIVSSNKKSTDIYNGWNTFTAPREKFTLKYPTDWKVVSGNNSESYDLTAPDGLIVRYVYLDSLDQEDGGCGHQSACPTQKILSIDTIQPKNHDSIQLIKTAPDEDNDCYGLYLNEADAAHKPRVGDNYYSDSYFFYSIKDISQQGRYGVFLTNSTAGVVSFNCKNMTEEQFFGTKSVQEANLILNSIEF